MAMVIPKNKAKAVQWITKVAAQEDADDQAFLGQRYFAGEGVQRMLPRLWNFSRRTNEEPR